MTLSQQCWAACQAPLHCLHKGGNRMAQPPTNHTLYKTAQFGRASLPKTHCMPGITALLAQGWQGCMSQPSTNHTLYKTAPHTVQDSITALLAQGWQLHVPALNKSHTVQNSTVWTCIPSKDPPGKCCVVDAAVKFPLARLLMLSAREAPDFSRGARAHAVCTCNTHT